jgi:hypothetical protein
MYIYVYLFLYGQIIDHIRKAEVFAIMFDKITKTSHVEFGLSIRYLYDGKNL